jgi:hypothetical protein
MISSGNQAHLKDKSSATQSLIAATQASSAQPERDVRVTKQTEKAMQPYEIRQLRDGTIDYSSYYARPVSLLTPNMYRFCRQAASVKTFLLVVVTVGAVAFFASSSTHRMACAQCMASGTSQIIN